MTAPTTPGSNRTGGPAGASREAAAPLLLIAAITGLAVLAADVWAAAGVAQLAGTGQWAPPPLRLELPLELVLHGPEPVHGPGGSSVAFTAAFAGLTAAQVAAVAGVAVLVLRRRAGHDRLLRRRQLGDLAGPAAESKARQLRPSLRSGEPVAARDRGLRLARIDGRDVVMSWEDVALIIMGPRSNKTSAVAVPSVLSAPGLTIATSNKADLWALTRDMRAAAGPVWVFDPQQITYTHQRWWWDPLRAIREAPDAGRVEAATRLAGHFMTTIGGQRRDPFFHAAGEQVLVSTLLAAAVSGGTLRDVLAWLQQGRRDAIAMLDHAGAGTEAADLEATLGGAEVTTKGITQTARTAVRALTSERILRWVTPPDTWRDPPDLEDAAPDTAAPDADGGEHGELVELDPWHVLAHGERGPATLYLLSKDAGAGTAAPVVAALVDRVLEVAEQLAQARGGRVDPPVVAVLDEAANICPIRQLPQLYSHYGSRGLQVLTMLQSYQQGVTVWGADGMDTLWSASTIKLVGAGVDDHAFLQRLSGLIGDHDAEKISISHGRGTGPSRQYSTTREPILPAAALRALPKTHAVLLATGRPAGLGQLLPWYRERDSDQIHTYLDTALTELRAAATDALGPDNPAITPTSTEPPEPPQPGSAAPGATTSCATSSGLAASSLAAPGHTAPGHTAGTAPSLLSGVAEDHIPAATDNVAGSDTVTGSDIAFDFADAPARPVRVAGWPTSAYRAAARTRARPTRIHTGRGAAPARRNTSEDNATTSNANVTGTGTTDTGTTETSGAAT